MTSKKTITLPKRYAELSSHARKAVREEYARVQEGKCSHCGSPLSESAAEHIMKKKINENLFPPNFFRWPVHLHHCHKTGLTIGAVHCICNAYLWQYHGE